MPKDYLGQGIQEWTKQNLWKIAFKTLMGYLLPKETYFTWCTLEYFVYLKR